MMDRIETLLSFLGTLITYILLWIFNPGHQYKEVQEGRMLSPNFERGRVFKSNRKRYLKESYVMLSDKQKEFDTNDEKCKNLLTISTFLLAAQVVITYFLLNLCRVSSFDERSGWYNSLL